MKRTTSMTEFTWDLNQPCDTVKPILPSPSIDRRTSSDFVETAHFLKSCFLCGRCLIPGRDIYMYRGDGAFCSLECRHQQITQDERREKYSLSSKKEVVVTSGVAATVSGKVEIVAAAV